MFQITYAGGTGHDVEITRVQPALTATPVAVSTSYNGAALNNTTYSDNTGNYTITGFQAGDNIASAGITLSGSMGFNGSTSTTVRNAGTYTLAVGTLTLSSTDSNYSLSFSNPNQNSYVITPALLSISAMSDTKTYDGKTTDTATPAYQVTGLPANTLFGGDSFASLSQAFQSKNVLGAGNSTLVVSYTLGDGNGGDNYSVSTHTASGTINPAPLSISATGVNKVYDGTTGTTVNLSDNRVAGDVFTDSYTLASFAGPNVGSAKPVSVNGISIFGPDAGNYTFSTTASTTADITARDLYVTANANSKTYGQTASDSGTITGVQASDGITASFSSAGDPASAPVGSGSDTITAMLSDPNSKLANYIVHETDATLTVNQATATITVTPYSVTYDSTAHTAAATATGVFNEDLSADLTLAGTTHTSAGTYNGDAWSFHDPNGNYADASGTVNDAIAQRDLYVTANANSKTYGQTASDSGTITGVQASDGITASFSSTGDPASAPVGSGSYTITAMLSDPNSKLANYIVHETDATLTVNQATATITVTPYSVTYDSTAHTAAATATGVFNEDLSADLTLAGTTHTSAGTYNGDAWSFHDPNGNYADASGTVNDAIAQRDLYVTANANSKTYGQTASDSGTITGVQASDGITASFSSAGDPASTRSARAAIPSPPRSPIPTASSQTTSSTRPTRRSR